MDISVIIPVYNAGSRLNECVKSVVCQKGIDKENIEIILIDDGSTDGSGQLCDDIAEKYRDFNIKVIHQQNQGVSQARNIGIKTSLGKYITFIDADDTIKDDAVHYLMTSVNSSNIKMVSMNGSTGLFSGYSYIRKCLLYKDTHVWGKLFDAEFIKQISFLKGITIGEDMLFLLDLAIKTGDEKSILCLSEQKYNYYDNDNGAMKRGFKLSFTDEIFCWDKAEEKLRRIRQESGNFADENVFNRLAVIKVYSSMLLAGKLALVHERVISDEEKRDFEKALTICKDALKNALSTKGTFKRLDMGYKVKVMLFKISPKIYFKLYGSWKNGR